MSHKALDDIDYELIKSAMLTRDSSALVPAQQAKLDRVISAGKIIDRYPVRKHAVAMLMAKYPEISMSTAYEDIRMAMRIFNSMHTFDYDWWHDWLLNNIVEQIQAAKESGDMKSWAAGHANLIKAIGEKPQEAIDPKLTRQHQFILIINNGKEQSTINLDSIDKLPQNVRKELSDNLLSEIDDAQTVEIMES